MPFFYSALEFFAWYSVKLFFRDITVINEENVPKEGATIIYGNHNNQFVDGMVNVLLFSFKWPF
jgi:glycerol-3-phosphate O-acyltransferase/dihydroxyacetone phosphate acyltransferase